MTGRKTIIGICLLCALPFSATAAQSAAAATKGTTAFTCQDAATGAGHFKGAHCKPGDAGTGANWDHVAISESFTTEFDGSNDTTSGGTEPLKLKATVAGIEIEIVATGVFAEGSVENKRTATGEHYVHGTTVNLGAPVYTSVTVAKPAGKGCKIDKDAGGAVGLEGLVEGNTTTATTEGQGDAVKFSTVGAPFATFFIQGCAGNKGLEALNKTYEVSGTVKGVPNGATVAFTHTSTTEQNTLRLNKVINAGIEGSMTFRGREIHFPLPEEFTGLSPTTVETP